jgi:CopZ-like zinc binding protein
MNCCVTDSASEVAHLQPSEIVEEALPENHHCRMCGRKGKPVSRKTVLLMVKPEFLEQAMIGRYTFCLSRDCNIVYFQNDGNHQFTVADLRIRVGIKLIEDPVPLCYCFGFDESHMRDEIAQSGRTTIPRKISHLISEGLCPCESRNPSGMCCLGEVNRTVRLLMANRQGS